MMQFIFKKWQEKLSQFESSVDQELKEIRKCKADIQKMRQEAVFELHKGRYIHDDERIILSAPEIIIGHVDRNGSLIGNAGSTVIVRSSQIGLQGVGEGGQVEMRARGIKQIAEDPGIDGEEHVVENEKRFVSDAAYGTLEEAYVLNIGSSTGITNLSDDDSEDGDYFTLQGYKIGRKPTKAGVYIHNGKTITIKEKK